MDDIVDIANALGRIEGKVDLMVSQGKVQDDRHAELEARVRIVESKQHWLAGVAATMGIIGSHLLSLVTGKGP